MGKWQPPHPAKKITRVTRCRLGQRYSSVDKVRVVTTGPLGQLTVKLKVVQCSWCQGGFHLVTTDELSRYRNALTEVSR